MQYVDMNEVAYDPTAVVFPGLGNCHGVVYQTNVGLFAMHIYGNSQTTPHKAPFFGDFVRRHRLGATAVGQRLYGYCPSNRYVNGPTEQKAELQLCADAVGFTGQIRGATWNIGALHWGTTYTECTTMGDDLQVWIEDFSAGTSNHGANASGLDHKSLTVRVQPGFGLTPMEYGSLKALDTVIVSVNRMPLTPRYNVLANVL